LKTKFTISILFLLLCLLSKGQPQCPCFIESVRNASDLIEQNGRKLRPGDSLSLNAKVTVNDKSNVIVITDTQLNEFRVGFENALVTYEKDKPDKQPLSKVSLIIAEYLEKFKIQSNVLGHKGNFDWFSYFRDTSFNFSNSRILFIENEIIPLQSEFVENDSSLQFYSLVFKGKDSILYPLKKNGDSLIITQEGFGLDQIEAVSYFSWKLFIGKKENGRAGIIEVGPAISSLFMSREYFRQLVQYLSSTFKSGEKVAIGDAIAAFISFNYGKLNPYTFEEYYYK